MLFQQLLLVPVQIVRNIRMRKDRFSRERFPCGIVWKKRLVPFPRRSLQDRNRERVEGDVRNKNLVRECGKPVFHPDVTGHGGRFDDPQQR